MSGPIVRKYGFPNFEKIFGERPIEHGVEEPESAGTGEQGRAESKPQPADAKKKDAPGPGKSKGS